MPLVAWVNRAVQCQPTVAVEGTRASERRHSDWGALDGSRSR